MYCEILVKIPYKSSLYKLVLAMACRLFRFMPLQEQIEELVQETPVR